jgi:hypothetical protein
VPEPPMGEGAAEVEAPAFMPGRMSTKGVWRHCRLRKLHMSRRLTGTTLRTQSGFPGSPLVDAGN